MKLIWGLVIVNGLLVGMNPNTPCQPKFDLKRTLGDDYSTAKKVAKQLPFALKDTCYKYTQATDSCATLLKLLIHVEKYPTEFNNSVVVRNIKENIAAIAQVRKLSPQTTNELVRGVLNNKPKHRYDVADWREKFNWDEEVRLKNLYRQFPAYLKEFCWTPLGSTNTDSTCYQLALLFYGLSPQRDKNGAYHQNKPLIKKIIKSIDNFDCFKSGLYTKKQLVADFIKAVKESKVD